MKRVAWLVLGLGFSLTACGGEPLTLDQEIDLSVQSIGSGGTDCVHPPSYWKIYNRYASNPANQVAWPVDEDSIGCFGRTAYDWFTTNPVKGDALHSLTRITIAAVLNTRAGAIPDANTQNALLTAKLFVGSCVVTQADQAQVFQLMNTLNTFVTGGSAPGLCP